MAKEKRAKKYVGDFVFPANLFCFLQVIDHRLTYLLRHLSALELKWLIRILLKDLRISLKENSILECFHPDAKDLFDHTSNLFKVAVYLHDPEKRLHEIGLSIFSPFRPMLGIKKHD